MAGIHEPDSTTDDNRISIEFVVLVYNDSSIVDQDVWVGAAVEIGTTQIWAGQLLVKITDNITLPTTVISLIFFHFVYLFLRL